MKQVRLTVHLHSKLSSTCFLLGYLPPPIRPSQLAQRLLQQQKYERLADDAGEVQEIEMEVEEQDDQPSFTEKASQEKQMVIDNTLMILNGHPFFYTYYRKIKLHPLGLQLHPLTPLQRHLDLFKLGRIIIQRWVCTQPVRPLPPGSS